MTHHWIVQCEGPLIWYPVSGINGQEAAILHCSVEKCEYIVSTGNCHDERHCMTPILQEGSVV